jgi:hypothetical protein
MAFLVKTVGLTNKKELACFDKSEEFAASPGHSKEEIADRQLFQFTNQETGKPEVQVWVTREDVFFNARLAAVQKNKPNANVALGPGSSCWRLPEDNKLPNGNVWQQNVCVAANQQKFYVNVRELTPKKVPDAGAAAIRELMKNAKFVSVGQGSLGMGLSATVKIGGVKHTLLLDGVEMDLDGSLLFLDGPHPSVSIAKGTGDKQAKPTTTTDQQTVREIAALVAKNRHRTDGRMY